MNDNLISKLNSLKNLKYLKINNTKITDKGLSSISSSVESLNLNENKLSFDGLKNLLEQKSLKAVYLWNTSINKDNQTELLGLSTAELNFGVSDFAKGVPLSIPATNFWPNYVLRFFKNRVL